MKVLAPHSEFSTTTPFGDKKHHVTARQASKSRLPIKPLLMEVVDDGLQFFLCGLTLSLSGYCLSFLFCQAALFYTSFGQSTSCCCLYLCLLAFLGYWLLQHSVQYIISSKKTQKNLLGSFLVSEECSQSAFFSPHFRVLCFFICNIQSIQLYLVERTGKENYTNCIYSGPKKHWILTTFQLLKHRD